MNPSTDLLPGGPLAARPLHFIWIADGSGSMGGAKIQALNTAIREAIPPMRDVARGNPNAQVLVRAVRFSAGANWHVAQPVPVETFTWPDLQAGGQTDMGRAMRLVADALRSPPMAPRALPPVLVLISDGQPTDDLRAGLAALMAEPWGRKAVRLAIAIGEDASLDALQAFVGNPEVPVLQAHDADQLSRYIRWASTAVLQASSAPPSQALAAGASPAPGNVPLPPPPAAGPSGPNDVW